MPKIKSFDKQDAELEAHSNSSSLASAFAKHEDDQINYIATHTTFQQRIIWWNEMLHFFSEQIIKDKENELKKHLEKF